MRKRSIAFMIILITSLLSYKASSNNSILDISIKSSPAIYDLTMNCNFEIDKDYTRITYDITIRSKTEIEFIEFFTTPSYDSPLLENKRITGVKGKQIAEPYITNEHYYHLNIKDHNIKTQEGYETNFFIRFEIKTENIIDLDSASSNSITFAYNYMTEKSILPSRIRVDIWLPGGYIIDSTIVEGWIDAHNRYDNRLWYFKEVYYNNKEGKLSYEFYFRFHQLPKSVEEKINNLQQKLEDAEEQITQLGKQNDTILAKALEQEKEQNFLKIVTLITLVLIPISFYYGNMREEKRKMILKFMFPIVLIGIIILIILLF